MVGFSEVAQQFQGVGRIFTLEMIIQNNQVALLDVWWYPIPNTGSIVNVAQVAKAPASRPERALARS